MQKNRVIAFDCDGTLLNTYNLIQQTFKITFNELFPDYQLSQQELESFFGPGLHETFGHYVNTKEEVNYCIERYRYHNHRIMADYIEVFDGITQMLQELKNKGYNIMIVSNKVSKAIQYGLELCQIEHYIEHIIGYEMITPKPDPDGIYKAKALYNVDNLVFVGDTHIDMETGKNANVPTIGVTWCKSTKDVLLKSGANFVIDHPKELIKVIEENHLL